LNIISRKFEKKLLKFFCVGLRDGREVGSLWMKLGSLSLPLIKLLRRGVNN